MKQIIFTAKYDNVKNGNHISVSGDRGKKIGYEGNSLSILAPKLEFWKVWHDNINKISEQENTIYYVRNYYNRVLKNLDPEILLESLPNKTILLCYEDSKDFCHRHLIAFWLELFLDIETYEIKEVENYKIQIQERPEYLKEILENVIKEDYNMHGFNSIRAAYLFEGAEQLERSIEESNKGIVLTDYECELYTIAAGLRVEADEAETKYLKEKNNKVKKYNI